MCAEYWESKLQDIKKNVRTFAARNGMVDYACLRREKIKQQIYKFKNYNYAYYFTISKKRQKGAR